MKIGVHGKEFDSSTREFIEHVLNCFKKEEGLFITESFHKYLGAISLQIGDFNTFGIDDDISYLDVFFTLGGDGTLLEAVTYIGDANIPILGINTGRLGFLATISKDNFDRAFQQILNKDYGFDERTLLKLESDIPLFNGRNFALNDFTILKQDTSSMIVVNIYVDGEFLNAYWADGVIVSTPTGSTGYNLSCGGPLVMPQSNNFIITPVSPHNLTVRPIVVPDSSELTFAIQGRNNNFLITLDSRFETVDSDVVLKIKKCEFKARLIKYDENSYFKTLRQKLNWGYDIRN